MARIHASKINFVKVTNLRKLGLLRIENCSNCYWCLLFMQVSHVSIRDLYKHADLGVWPVSTPFESDSLSGADSRLYLVTPVPQSAFSELS